MQRFQRGFPIRNQPLYGLETIVNPLKVSVNVVAQGNRIGAGVFQGQDKLLLKGVKLQRHGKSPVAA